MRQPSPVATLATRARVPEVVLLVISVIVALMTVASNPAPATAVLDEQTAPIHDQDDLELACGMDVLMILDESASVAGNADNVRDAYRAFASALRNTNSRMAVVEFSTVARLPLTDAAQQAYTTITDTSIATTFEPYIVESSGRYSPEGLTDWEDALRVGRFFVPPDSSRSHLTVFITDGNPNLVVDTRNVTQEEYRTVVPLDGSLFGETSHSRTRTAPRSGPCRTPTR